MSRTAVFVPESFAAPSLPLSSARFRAVDAAADAASAAMVMVAGELDIAPVADRELRRAEAHAELVIVDLRALELIDASGARRLVAAHRRIRARRRSCDPSGRRDPPRNGDRAPSQDATVCRPIP
jgi:hypothetical protein